MRARLLLRTPVSSQQERGKTTSGSRKQPRIHVSYQTFHKQCARVMFQTDSDEDVIFVSECVPNSHEIAFDQAKRLALQRHIDEQSQPQQLAKPLTSQRSAAVERPVERVKMKTGEEKSEDKLVKKEKKQKKGQIKNDNCPVDDGGSQAEVKKEKKKVKKVDAVVIDIEEESGGKEEKKKKKKRKIVTESPNDANGSDVKTENDKEVIIKKKKKKQLADGENQAETAQISLKDEVVDKKKRKEKKVKNKSVQIKSENVKMKMVEEEQQAENDKLPKKAKKEKTNTLVVSTEAEEQVEVKKKKKKEKSTDEETSETIDEINVTKKKKQSKVAQNIIKLETPEGDMDEAEEVKKSSKKGLKEKKEKEKYGDCETVTIEEEETELKKKKKRKKGASKGEEKEPASLKCEGVEEQSRETPVSATVDTTSKKKKRKISGMIKTEVEDVSFESSAKKKKRKKIKEEVVSEQELPQVDVVFLSAKSGNTDEVSINQERRQALQMEIDQASQPKNPARPTGLGQWSTAQFDSSDQQQKFLRLMGGFKKGFQPAAGSPGQANMALGKDAQQQLQQGLLGEFERAHSRRMDFNNRGTGLGFTAPSNKKFFIDVNASRSVRFDD